MTQEELANRLGVTKRVIGTWERQDTQITLADACAVAKILNCTPNDLCGWYIDHPEDRPADGGAATDLCERELVANYRALTPQRRRVVSEMVEDMAGRSQDAGRRSGSYEEAEAAS